MLGQSQPATVPSIASNIYWLVQTDRYFDLHVCCENLGIFGNLLSFAN